MNSATVTVAALAAFSEAWNRHDVDALMSFMTDDCVFESAAGPDVCGTRFVGRDEVRRGFAAAWAALPDAHWDNGVYHVMGDWGVSEWLFTGTGGDGSRVEVNGVDVFTFRGDKIQCKNAFRKVRPNLPALR